MNIKILFFSFCLLFAVSCSYFDDNQIYGYWKDEDGTTKYFIDEDRFIEIRNEFCKKYVIKNLTDSTFVLSNEIEFCRDSIVINYRLSKETLSIKMLNSDKNNIEIRARENLIRESFKLPCQEMKTYKKNDVSLLKGKWIESSYNLAIVFDRNSNKTLYYGDIYAVNKYEYFYSNNLLIFFKKDNSGHCVESYKFKILNLNETSMNIQSLENSEGIFHFRKFQSN
jgi:hypothetical protein